jgi:sec-independent protein translocase protein TatC
MLVDLWAFISPGLLPRERRYVAYGLPIALLLFVLGVAFAYLVFPVGMRFLYSFAAGAGLKPFWSITSYLKFLLWSCIAVGVIFELPLVTGLLAVLGVVSSEFLAGKRRHAIVAILIVAAVITPSVDMITMLVVSAPIIVLYEAGIQVAKRVEKIRKRQESNQRTGET